MTGTFKDSPNEFTATMRKLIALSSRGETEFVNSRMGHVIKAARDATPIATRGQIQQELGAELVKQRKSNKGKLKRSYRFSPTPVVYAIVNAHQRKLGRRAWPRSEIKRVAEKFIAQRLRAVGSLRAGWTRALAIFGRAIKQPFSSEGPAVKKTSRGLIAKPPVNQAEVEYRMTVDHGLGRHVDDRVVRALEIGFSKENVEMNMQLEKKMNQIIKEAGAA